MLRADEHAHLRSKKKINAGYCALRTEVQKRIELRILTVPYESIGLKS